MQLKSMRYFTLSFLLLLVTQLLFAQTQEIDLVGNGNTILDGSANPSVIDDTHFGNTAVASNVVHTFTINNTGGDPLTINGITITGTNPGNFTISGIAFPAVLTASGGTTTFMVTFSPPASGISNATVTVNNDDLDEAAYDFAIRGSSRFQEIELIGNGNTILDGSANPSVIDDTDFGNVAIGGNDVHTFTINNIGTDPLEINGITITGVNPGDFTVTGITFPAILAASGGTTTFMVTFSPIASGIRNAIVTVNNDDLDESEYNFEIEGNSTPSPCFPTINSTDVNGNSTTIICNNNPLTLTPSVLSNCSSCTYEWSDNTTGPYAFAYTTGTYQVTVTDNSLGGCVGVSTSIQVTATTLAEPMIAGDSFYICDPVDPVLATTPALMLVSNPCPNCNYQWFEYNSISGSSTLIGGETNITFTTSNPGEYYVVVTDPGGAPNCYENSKIVIVKTTAVTSPSLIASTTSLCDSNTSVLTTIDCNGCNYQWNYYDYAEEGKLIISGVFDGTRPDGGPNGIELYAIGNISDLSRYNLEILLDGGPTNGGSLGNYQFPSTALAGGSYIYVTDNADEFTAFFGFPATYQTSAINIDGNDVIEVYYDDGGTPVLADVYGDIADFGLGPFTIYPSPWAYNDGWASRNSNVNPNSSYTDAEWRHGQGNFDINRTNIFWGTYAMPIGTYTTPQTPSTDGLIISAVFSDTIGGSRGRGIEFYVTSYIPNLSVYSIKTVLDGNGQIASAPSYTFPSGAVNAGTYIYLTDDLGELNTFFPSLGGRKYADPIISSIDGNDAILLYNGLNVIDEFGETTHTGTVAWDYSVGWAKSNDNRNLSTTFLASDWSFSPNAWTCSPVTTNECTNSPGLELAVGTTVFTTYASSLILSAVFDGSGNGDPRGIEVYAIDAINDLSTYSLDIYTAGGAATPAFTYTFPNVSLVAGARFHLTDDGANFSSLFGIPVGSVIAGLSVIDGNDAIELVFNSTVVDAIGDKALMTTIGSADYSMSWAYQDGWLYRYSNTFPNQGTFIDGNWELNNHAYRATNNAFIPTNEEIEIQSYVNNDPGTVLSVIQGQYNFTYETGTTGDYIVLVEYPNGCIAESDTIGIDTLIFTPEIEALIPSSVRPNSNPTGDRSTDTTYLCSGSTVELYMIGAYALPPNWTYQWSRNSIDLVGATGYNYSAMNSGLYRVKVIDDNGCIAFSNTIVVVNSTNGANPSISASSLYLCSSTATSTLITSACIGCEYDWRKQDGFAPNGTSTNRTYEVQGSDAGGYFVRVTDAASGCIYESAILLIRDTTYAAPSLTANSPTVCSAGPIDLVTTPCAGCDYIWKIDSAGTFISFDTTQQFTGQITTAGKYRVEILYPDGCQTTFSNTIQATFQTVNANIATPPLTSICNTDPVIIYALPDTIDCPTCTYQFLRDSIRMQQDTIKGQQELNLGGDYQVVVTNEEGCADTSTAITFTEVSIATDIRQSTKKICGPTSSMVLEIDSCDGCAYQWYVGNTTLISSQDTFYVATGYSAVETYTVEVSKLGCIVIDSVVVDSVEERTITIAIDSNVSQSPTICDGSAVVLEDTCQNCITNNEYQYQWFRGGSTIVGASFEAYQVDTASTYYVAIIDTNNCTAVSNSITVQSFDPPANFVLDFDTSSVLPITYGTLSLDDYLYPTNLRNTGGYTSLTAGGAIQVTSPNVDSINIGVAGSGFHYINYSYTIGNASGTCTFSTFDTIEVLGAVAMDILNKKRITEPSIPSSEACLYDTLLITITNFTFIPNEVIFVTGGGNTTSVTPFNLSLTMFAGVHSGTLEVIVPAGARTGKITLSNGTDSYQSPNFYLIQNPAVTINLLTGTQPICSSVDTAEFVGLPSGGNFSAHYLGMPTDSSLFIDSLLLLDSVTNYTAGIQNVMMVYTYTPLYTGTTIACRDSVLDSLSVEIRDVELDSVHYTSVSRARVTEDLANLTLITYPVSARNYPNTYTGTYVLGSNLLPSTIPTNISQDSITYQITNGVCQNESTDPIDIWPAPGLLDSIPTYLCSKDDTVFIQRNTDSLWVLYQGDTIYSNTLYTYSQSPNPITVGDVSTLGVRYTEQINLMEIMTSNGGVDSINFLPPNDEYFFVPANVTGSSTTLSFKFSYERISNFFINGALSSTETTNYVIAEISKNFIIEQPAVVAINPVILADTIFCPINNNNQFLGLPAGGQYYLSGTGVGYSALPNNIFNPTNGYATGTSYGLTYVYEGQACIDSAYTGIYLPDPFSIQVQPNNGTGEYCKTSPNDSIFFGLLTPTPPIPSTFGIDTSSAQFFINNIQSGTVFSPVQVGPPGQYNVRYVVADIYGCQAEATDVFEVFPIPDLSKSTVDLVYCLNDDTTQIHLYQTEPSNNRNTLTTWPGSGGIGYNQNQTVEFTGNGIIDGGTNPLMPYFYPRDAGVGTHEMRYVYADSNSCMDSIIFPIQVLSLPIVSMKTATGDPIAPYYCENDSISLIGFPITTTTPSGYGTDTSVLYGNPDINSLYPTSLDTLNRTFKPFVAGTQPGILREVLFYYYEDPQGCRDTARYSVTIRNFTTDPTIAGLPSSECASDLDLPVWANLNGGFDLDSLGWFMTDYPTGFSQIGLSPNTDSIQFYPDSMGIEFANRDVVLTFHYSDTSRNCFNSISDTVLVRALPHLTLSEQLVNSLSAMDLPGSKMINPGTDTVHYHMCETAAQIPVYAYNTTGLYDPFTGTVTVGQPGHITPDVGAYVGRGIQSNGSTVNIAYGYIPLNAVYGGDTVTYTFTDAAGCTDSIEHYMFVDTLPVLAFAGLSNYDMDLNRFVYCETEPNPPSISATPSGVAGSSLFFNNQSVSLAAPFDLLPDTLAVPGVYVDYPLQYNYIGNRYANGAVCASVLQDTIQIRPAPQLAWVNVPSTYCMLDTLERLPLSATPRGGQFVDATNNFQVVAGIVGDTLFNPAAQPGKRDIYYYYRDTTSGCDDTIQHTIYVYNKPRVNFDISGGCSGTQVDFIPRTAPYGLVNDGVAIDSITMVIWDFGDGVADTLIGANLPNTLGIPSDTHTYAGAGIFYPSLTVVNQGGCDTVFRRRIIISPRVTPTPSLPYVENFDLPENGWMQESSDSTSVNGIVQDSLWQWGTITTPNFAGTGFWGTRFSGTSSVYRPEESAWVYSPCFDLDSLERPMIKMSIWRNTRRGIDGAVLQYYDDTTNTWEVLGQYGKGINWYQDGYVVSAPGNQLTTPVGWSGANNANTVSGSTWEDARYRLDNIGNDLRGRTDVRFRVAFASARGTSPQVGAGFAFDSVRIGERTRNVLTEHFSGLGYPGISQIEDQLYHTIFNNLYGRDVSLIQYHLNVYANDIYYSYNGMNVINDTRKLWYGVGDVDRVRVDGKNLVSKTSDLLNYPQLEYLDIESLKDPKFKLELIGSPAITFNGASGLVATVRITALEDLPLKNYSLHVVATEDSLTSSGHTRMAVLRDKHLNATGYRYEQSWVAGESYDLLVNLPNVNVTNNPILSRIQLVAFVQNMGDTSVVKEVYQTISSRNITLFTGSVDTLDVSVDNIEDQLGYEVTTFKLYPNPTQALFNVEFEASLEDDYEWQLVDVVGRVLKNGKVQAGTTLMQVATEELSSGMYIFVIKNKNVYTQRKVIVQKN